MRETVLLTGNAVFHPFSCQHKGRGQAKKAFLQDKWSVECHYPMVHFTIRNDASIEKNSVKMYGNGDRR